MHFPFQSVLALALPLMGHCTVLAAAVKTEAGGLQLLRTEVRTNDAGKRITRTIWGYNETFSVPAPRPLLAARSCGSNDVGCDSNPEFLADKALCGEFIGNLFNNSNKFAGFPHPRALCEEEGGNQCCVNWNADVPGLRYSSLWNAAKDIFEKCSAPNNPLFVGWATNVNLEGICVNQCVSRQNYGCN